MPEGKFLVRNVKNQLKLKYASMLDSFIAIKWIGGHAKGKNDCLKLSHI